ncbi:flagellar filament capping protein FliD [Frateuria hangzhouensis]|uniref:flagellar filament capping protein FliD n=1 Tax=Frateuria hangzhouensis TaxID=2995589 RepID=UPI002260D2FC|nr:flagellar filament capping protein FliD [Frateuria sp. STR12]MCX7513134.1 flagellar filament capping protein FliD [Frateuria sp. STR12]
MALTVGSTAPTTGLLTSMGVGSGIDVDKLVTTLVEAKKKPQQDQITNLATATNTELSGLGQISAALSALQSAMAPLSDGSAFSARTISSSETDVLSASGTAGGPVSGNYAIEVTQLASSLKASSGAFETANTAVGTGTLTLSVDGQSMSLELGEDNNSLAAIRDAINKSPDNPGIAATIVTGTDGAHLVLSGTRTGAANGFTVSSSGGDGGLAALSYDPAASSGNALSVITEAQDAQYTIDGLAGHSASNTVSGAIDGLTLNLVKEGSSKVTVADDDSKATSALTNLVNTYNSFVGIYKGLTRYDQTTGTAGAMIGDSTLNSISSKLANIVSSAANGSTLASIGISLQVDGTLELDSDKLKKAMSDGGAKVANLFGGENGFSARFTNQLDQWMGDSGVIANRTESLSEKLKDLSDQQQVLDTRMADLTARYQAQFTALDTLMAKLNSTSSYLTQQFDALMAANKNK